MTETGEKKFSLCKAFEDMKLEGVEIGTAKGQQLKLVELVCKKIQKGKHIRVIAEELEEEVSVIEKIAAVQKKTDSFDAERICSVMQDDTKR